MICVRASGPGSIGAGGTAPDAGGAGNLGIDVDRRESEPVAGIGRVRDGDQDFEPFALAAEPHRTPVEAAQKKRAKKICWFRARGRPVPEPSSQGSSSRSHFRLWSGSAPRRGSDERGGTRPGPGST